MRDANDVAKVRAAESELMAVLPDGALMQRAAAGLASVCATLLGRTYGSRVVVLTGSGDNGGDALYAAAHLARRGAAVIAVAAGSRAHEGGAAALRAWPVAASSAAPIGPSEPAIPAGPTSSWTGCWASAGQGRTAGSATQRWQPANCAISRLPWSRWTCPAASMLNTARLTAPPSARTSPSLSAPWKPGLLVDPGAAHAGVVELVDNIGLGPHLGPPRRRIRRRPPDVGRDAPGQTYRQLR